MKEYSNGGVVNEEDLPPIIPLPYPIRVLEKFFAKNPFFYPLILHYMHKKKRPQQRHGLSKWLPEP